MARLATQHVSELKREILHPYDLNYPDLITLSSSSLETTEAETKRLQEVSRSVLQALGPTGPGLLTITGVPNASSLRTSLLPLARDLSLLTNDHRKRILKDHGLGSDVPLKNLNRCVSSYAMQLKYGNDMKKGNVSCGSLDGSDKAEITEGKVGDCENKLVDEHFKDLGIRFRELGFCMIDVGLRVARICDRAIGGNELEDSLLESGTAKGRLIHYHSHLDTRIIKEMGSRTGCKRGKNDMKHGGFHSQNRKRSDKGSHVKEDDKGKLDENGCDFWQQWHYDYGTFTVLTTPMFIRPNNGADDAENSSVKFTGLEYPPPSGNTYLQILHPLKNVVCDVKTPPESFVLQVGESADVLSGRKLQSTLHSVTRPSEFHDLSREAFVVFLHPAWDKVFRISDYPTDQSASTCQNEENGERPRDDEQELKKLTHEIFNLIPPLLSRLRDGMTFSEFSRETTRQYYGGNGLKSNR